MRLQSQKKYGKMLVVRDGWLECPVCRARRLLRITPELTARNLPVFCRRCKNEIKVDIEQGQSFQSQSQ